jgi:hypothetical protein
VAVAVVAASRVAKATPQAHWLGMLLPAGKASRFLWATLCRPVMPDRQWLLLDLQASSLLDHQAVSPDHQAALQRHRAVLAQWRCLYPVVAAAVRPHPGAVSPPQSVLRLLKLRDKHHLL